MKSRILVSTVLGLSLAVASARALAHHSFSAEFDANKRATFAGAVTNVEWRNPHTWFYVDVKDEAGNVVNWGFELASPNLLMRNGWSRSSMKVGDAVIVEAYLAKNGLPIANAHVVTLTSTGQSLFTGSSKGSAP